MIGTRVIFSDWADDAAGISEREGVCGNALCNDRACADDAAFPDRDSGMLLYFCARMLRMPRLCHVRADKNLAIEKFYFSIFHH